MLSIVTLKPSKKYGIIFGITSTLMRFGVVGLFLRSKTKNKTSTIEK